MNKNLTTTVGDKTFVAKFHDYTGEFIEDYNKNKNGELSGDPQKKIDQHDDQGTLIGNIVKLDVENSKLENIAALVMPEKYGKELVDEYREFENKRKKEAGLGGGMMELMALFGGGNPLPYEPMRPELAEELGALEFTIIDQFPIPGDDGIMFKVVRNDNTDITFWMFDDAFDEDSIIDPADPRD